MRRTAEVDGITSTNPQNSDTDNDGLNDSYEALTLLTDPTSRDTDNDGIPDGVEINSAYGNLRKHLILGITILTGTPLMMETRMQMGTESLMREKQILLEEKIQEMKTTMAFKLGRNLSCTEWNVADTDFGGIDGDERNVSHGTDPCDSLVNFATSYASFSSANQLFVLVQVD